jgi:hypothetical protein
LKRFCNSSDLIDFKKQCVTCFLLNSFFDTNRVCNSEIVTNDLMIVFT